MVMSIIRKWYVYSNGVSEKTKTSLREFFIITTKKLKIIFIFSLSVTPKEAFAEMNTKYIIVTSTKELIILYIDVACL